jgi:nicotinamidase-related amidase
MDMQAGIVAMLPDATAIIENAAKAIAAARSNNIPVIYVVVGFRNTAPEISEASAKSFAGAKALFSNVNMDEFMAVHPAVAPQQAS